MLNLKKKVFIFCIYFDGKDVFTKNIEKFQSNGYSANKALFKLIHLMNSFRRRVFQAQKCKEKRLKFCAF